MKIKLRKRLALPLVSIMILTTIIPTSSFANEITGGNIVLDEDYNKINLSNSEINEILENAGIDKNTVKIISPEDAFSGDDIDKFIEQTKIQEEKEAIDGFTRTETILVEPKIKGRADGIECTTVVDNYTGKEEILNKKSNGMAHWVDVIFNLTIGVKTKYAWKAATFLGISPSTFQSKYINGDKLSSTISKVKSRRCYKKYNPVRKSKEWYLETSKLDLKNYVDLYTLDKNNKSVRKSKTDSKTYYTEHYSDTTWINNYVNNACKQNLSGPRIDTVI
ncbi:MULTISPECIES: hypothetical protein [unclassified Clostridioides]|uniref:hypothetical protein n=1 Tax=unclassified Clostridioides TaxID=2635829 RepID=UPI0038B0810C